MISLCLSGSEGAVKSRVVLLSECWSNEQCDKWLGHVFQLALKMEGLWHGR